MLDPEKPLESLSRKMVKNIFNGPFENKVKSIESMVKELNPDAVINFCHWGCKQARGGNMLLKESMKVDMVYKVSIMLVYHLIQVKL